jgi:hypothetical protein
LLRENLLDSLNHKNHHLKMYKEIKDLNFD